ncbi:MAG: alkaline phosphatase family protein [Acidobacteria bacterium]|nr:alkaline phosphatase family protein [Acidobacteriota bacterium]
MREKIIMIGLDGGSFNLLKPWMDQGALPNLKHIETTGITGPLESSIPPVTSPAWPCFMTGKNPGKHGISFFFRPKPGSYEEIPINSANCDASTLWELLSRDGHRVAVLNVPTTYPPQKVNGMLISDFKMPSEQGDLAYPPEVLEEIEQQFGPYRITVKTPVVLLANQSEANIEFFLQECQQILDYKCNVAAWLLEKYDCDFFMLHILETDRLQHWLWNILDPAHPKYKSELAKKFHGQIQSYYRALDAHIGRIMQLAGPEATIIIMSDHGFGVGQRAIDLATWLLEEGYLKIKDDVTSQMKLRLWRMGWTPEALGRFILKYVARLNVTRGAATKISKRATARGRHTAMAQLRRNISPIFLSANDIDWTKTKAFCSTGPGQIRINLKGREPLGTVNPGPEYDALVDEIIAKLKSLRDPETGQRVDGQVYAKEDVYHGPHLDHLPDITYVPIESGYSAVNLVDFKSNKVMIDDILATGIHRSKGILMATGKAIRQSARIEGANIMDLAPTILYLMGSQIPHDMDGKVLAEMFTEEFLAAHSTRYVENLSIGASESLEVSPEDEEEVLERLRGWGYID